jgi:hypothetical protein
MMKKRPRYCPFYLGQPTEKEREECFWWKQQADAVGYLFVVKSSIGRQKTFITRQRALTRSNRRTPFLYKNTCDSSCMQNSKASVDASKRHILSDARLDDLIREAFLDHPELRDQIDQGWLQSGSAMWKPKIAEMASAA